MKPEKINSWLTLIANAGVLGGILFLGFEISQSNGIATNQAEMGITDKAAQINRISLQYSDLLSKLKSSDSNFTPDKEIQCAWACLATQSRRW